MVKEEFKKIKKPKGKILKSNNLQKRKKSQKMELEKQLLQFPQSLEAQLKYLSFLLENESADIARGHLEKCLQMTCLQSNQSRTDLWKIYLNLELNFGNFEGFKLIAQRAWNQCDYNQIIFHVLDLLMQKEDFQNANYFLEILLKKSKEKEKAWLKVIEFLLKAKKANKQKQNNQEKQNCIETQLDSKIKETMKRGLQSIEKNKHIQFLISYSLLCYKNGEIKEARINLENILFNFPNKPDIWTVFIDNEIKYTKEIEFVRELFKKAIETKMKAKAARNLFKKFMGFEMEHGDLQSQSEVKEKAERFVQRLMEKKNKTE